MTGFQTLADALGATHAALAQRLEGAAAGTAGLDSFCAVLDRHRVAVTSVLAPTVRERAEDGPALVHALHERYRGLDALVDQVSARRAGATAYDLAGWDDLRARLADELGALARTEHALASALLAVSTPDDPDWARMLGMAEAAGPLRAGPRVPSQRRGGVIATLAAGLTLGSPT